MMMPSGYLIKGHSECLIAREIFKQIYIFNDVPPDGLVLLGVREKCQLVKVIHLRNYLLFIWLIAGAFVTETWCWC